MIVKKLGEKIVQISEDYNRVYIFARFNGHLVLEQHLRHEGGKCVKVVNFDGYIAMPKTVEIECKELEAWL